LARFDITYGEFFYEEGDWRLCFQYYEGDETQVALDSFGESLKLGIFKQLEAKL